MRVKRKKEQERDESNERWLISYADFITILFTFFAALFALSTVDTVKVEKLAGSLREAFRVMDDPIPLALLHEDKNRVVIEDLRKIIADTPGVSVRGEPGRIVIAFPGTALFPFGSADIKQDTFDVLESLSKALSAIPGRITIEGHTDNIPMRPGGRYRTNWELSAARAASVLHFFIAMELDPNKFSIAGYGQHRPVYCNDTEEGRAKNRRVEVVISQ